MAQQDHADEYSFVEESSDNFNPLEQFDFDDSEDIDEDDEGGMLDEGPYSMPDAQNVRKFAFNSFANGETAEQRIDALFEEMPTLDRMLITMLEMSRKPIPSDELNAQVSELQRTHHTIYKPLTLANLLERAGAIYQSDAEGTPLKDVEREPLRVTVDGVDYWQVAPAPDVFWAITPEGLERYEAYKPAEMIKAVFEDEPNYRKFFLATLNACAQEGGASMKVLDKLISDAPELQNPRRYAMYFIDKLEKAGALEWGDTWQATAAGRAYLDEQAQQQDAQQN